jgi:hypothetical protein
MIEMMHRDLESLEVDIAVRTEVLSEARRIGKQRR